MSARTITLSSSVHFMMSCVRSWRNLILGHVTIFFLSSNPSCCWYVVKSLSDLRGQYTEIICKCLLFSPHNLAQHHHPSPTLSSPGCCVQWVNWLIITNAVPPVGMLLCLFLEYCVKMLHWLLSHQWVCLFCYLQTSWCIIPVHIASVIVQMLTWFALVKFLSATLLHTIVILM